MHRPSLARSLSLAAAAAAAAACSIACHDWESLSTQYGAADGGPPVCTAFVVAGNTDSCARRVDGSLVCWGDNRYGQLGVGDTVPHDGPQLVQGPWPGVSKVFMPPGTGDLTASQSWFACAIDTQGTLWCWGDNSYGQLGDGTTTERTIPARVMGLVKVTHACTGASHACAGTSDGTLWCWGSNASGQLGTGDNVNHVVPAMVDVSAFTTSGDGGVAAAVDSLQCGAKHTCAHRTDGTMWCWGDNSYGQLGDGSTTARNRPIQVTMLGTNVGRVGTGGAHTCAFTKDGSVWCWGNNASGQLGVGDMVSRSVPTKLNGIPAVNQVWTGGAHTCALDTGGTLYCWGDNQYGQLGTGKTTVSDVPVVASPAVAAQAVQGANAGGAHTCALRTDGAVLCWGNDQYEQLGVRGHSTLDPVTVFPPCP
jgi:alpha-tubulin suppressor-like RCC1 family protein